MKGYITGEKLGQGGFGITYRGFDVKLRRKVAIKEYYPSDFVGRSVDRKTVVLNSCEHEKLFESGLKAFLKEARTLALVNHPYLVQVLNHFEMYGTAYLVMNFYEGQELKKYLEKQPGNRLLWQQAVKWWLPMLEGLQAVHKAGFMHLDIKPANLYLANGNHLILLDFGAARQIGSPVSKLILTEGYAPYEQCELNQSKRRGSQTDVYAAAAALYVVLTAQRLPPALERINSIRFGQPDPLQPARHFVPDLPQTLDDVLRQALALEPEQRLQSAEELKQQLEAVWKKEKETPSTVGTIPKPLKNSKRPTKLILRTAVAALIMMVVLAWVGWWIGFGRSPEPTHPKSEPSAATPPAAEAPPALQAPSVAPLPDAVTPPVVETPPAVVAPPVAPLPVAPIPPAVEMPPAVETLPVVEPVATAAVPSASDDAARQKRLDLQLGKAKKLLKARKVQAARQALDNAKMWDREGRVEAFRRQWTVNFHTAAEQLLKKGQQDRAKRVVDALGQWDPQSPEYQAVREKLASQR